MMGNLKIYILLATGAILGQAIRVLRVFMRKKSAQRDRIKQFNEAIDCLSLGQSVFVSRINDTVTIDLRLKDYGVVNLSYHMNKKEVVIFKESKVLHTTEGMQEIYKKIYDVIMQTHGSSIADVVTVLGVTISREEVESHLKNIEELKGMIGNTSNELSEDQVQRPEKSEVQKIIEENEDKLDIDSILDMINKRGMKSLTKKELEFLKKQSQK